ncbi:MAG: glycosyltransferase family 39 protein [Candidatus Nitrosocaldus sp.]
MKRFEGQYWSLFILPWFILFIIYPAWALPVSQTSRFIIFSSLLLYLSISGYILHKVLKWTPYDKPFFIPVENLPSLLKQRVGLLIICSIAFILHLYPITFPIILNGDEASHLQGGVGIYLFLNNIWERSFDIPIQYPAWLSTVIIVILYKRLLNLLKKVINMFFKPYFIAIIIIILFGYFFLLKDLPYHRLLVREPPVAKILYLVSYLYSGITPIAPRILQIIFYLLTGFYLYRTINLYKDKETGLLGASIYLFSPIISYFSTLAELQSGVIFFIIIVSFYFLRFLRGNDLRDIIIASFFIGVGFLYKRDILLMFFICSVYLMVFKVYNKNFHIKLPLTILSLSLIPVIPWMIIGSFFSERNYKIIWEHLTSIEMLFRYFSFLPSQLSWIVFLLFLVSILYISIKERNNLTTFFLLLFLGYYMFYTADIMVKEHRFSMAFYPTIAVFIAIFISGITQMIKERGFYKLTFTALTIYLMAISTIYQAPPLEKNFVTYKDIMSRYFPVDEAMRWVRDNVKKGEKMLVLRVAPSVFYMDKYNIDREKIIDFWYDLSELSTPQKLRIFCERNNITYIMFSYGPTYPIDPKVMILGYLKQNHKKEFAEVKKFNMDGNYIYIYRINNPNPT